VPTVVFEELIIIVTYLLACNLVVQHVVSCNWVLPVGNIFIIIISGAAVLIVVDLPPQIYQECGEKKKGISTYNECFF
jgi:hypothetical protein